MGVRPGTRTAGRDAPRRVRHGTGRPRRGVALPPIKQSNNIKVIRLKLRELRGLRVRYCGYAANRIRAFRVNDNIRAGVATVGTKVDEVAKKMKCGRRRGKYDDETVAFCVAVLSAAEDNETIKSGINFAAANAPEPVRDIPVKGEILV